MEEDDDNESSDSDASDKNVKKSRQLSSVVRVKQVFFDFLKSHHSIIITVIEYARLLVSHSECPQRRVFVLSKSFLLVIENTKITLSRFPVQLSDLKTFFHLVLF